MKSLITSYLLQNKECVLPSIGILKIETKPAEADIINKQMLPPAEEIIFREHASLQAPGLIKYISLKKEVDAAYAEDMLKDFCTDHKEKMKRGERLNFETFGSLQINSAGNIYFRREQANNFLQPVRAERVAHQTAEHSVLVGDAETTSAVMNEYLAEEENSKRSRWGIWAAVLAAVALGGIIYHFSTHQFNGSSTGNTNQFEVAVPAPTHVDITQ